MHEEPFGNWPLEDLGGDDLFGLDTNALLRPNRSSGGDAISEVPSPLTSFTSIDSDVFDPVFPVDQELGLLDSGYISSNSSDSGKHSPSGSESHCEQGSPWSFPEQQPVLFQQEQPVSRIAYQKNNRSSFSFASFPSQNEQPQTTYYAQTFSPPAVAPPVTPNKVIYVVPSSTPAPVPVTPTYTVNNPAIYIKPEPLSSAPIYISQTTGNQLQPISIVQTTSPNLPKFAVVGRDPQEEEAIRRLEDRKAKNRASAQASRAKKRNELDDAKRMVSALKDENARLLAENNSLKLRLARYEVVKDDGSPSRKRAALAGGFVMAIFMMVTVAPFQMEDTSRANIHPPSIAVRRSPPVGRILSDIVIAEPITNGTSCLNKKNFNSTEAIRLNNDLYEWVDRHRTMGIKGGKRLLLQKTQKDWASSVGNVRVSVTEEETVSNSTKKAPAKKQQSGDRLWRHLDMISAPGSLTRERRERLLKGGKTSGISQKNYDKLSAAIQQKEDTLYVVALEDYFLLPALERNNTSQPRLTLILPALSQNSTVAGKITLMRIDLRVVGTGLFNLSRQLLPLFLH